MSEAGARDSTDARVEHTFLFADLSGFTALTEAHGDEQSAELTNEFFASVRALLPEHRAEVVKTIGDAVMIRADAAADGVQLGLRIVHEAGEHHGFPSIRVGMHTGPATRRASDWFGATVNTAARISGVATGGEVLISDATREAAGAVDGVDFHERGREQLKNVAEPVLLHAAVRQGRQTADALPIDPVCRMAVMPARAAGRMTYNGIEYHFCSLACANSFSATPDHYVGDGEQATRTGPARSLAALVQGGSYIGFGLWSLLARDRYRRTHGIKRDDWVLNAHGVWLLVVGSTLAVAGLRGQADRLDLTLLGAGSAAGLALNDLVSLRQLPDIYRADLAYEIGLVGTWLATAQRRSS